MTIPKNNIFVVFLCPDLLNFEVCFKFSELPRRLPQIDVSENISGLAIKLTIN